jgi:hypothetical protein
MPKRVSQKRQPKDVNQLARQLVNITTGALDEEPTDAEVSKVMAALGRRGGKIGGKRRLVTMTPAQRSAVARKAARAKWAKRGTK